MLKVEEALERLSAPIFVTIAALASVRVLVSEWWRDEYQSWAIAAFSSDIPTMLHALRYEGHPALFYLFLFPFAHSGISPSLFRVVLVGLQLAALWILWRERRVPVWFKVAVATSVVWAETLLARGYILLPIFIIGSALIRAEGRDPNRRLLAWLVLGLAPSTHLMGWPAAAGIGLLWFLEDRRQARWQSRDAVGPLIAAIVAVLASLPAVPAPDADNPFKASGSLLALAPALALTSNMLGPLTRFVEPVLLGLGMVLGTTFITQRQARLCWLATVLGSMFVSAYTGSGYPRMSVGLLSALVVFCASDAPLRGARRWMALGVAAAMLIPGFAVIPTRTLIPNGAAGPLARDLRQRIPSDAEIIVTPDFFAAAVASESSRLVWTPECECHMGAAVWSRAATEARARGPELLRRAVLHAEGLSRQGLSAVLITSSNATMPSGARLLSTRRGRAEDSLSAWVFSSGN